ncbi:MAG: tetratricopeptide repeat protein [Rhodospirillales bacterium]
MSAHTFRRPTTRFRLLTLIPLALVALVSVSGCGGLPKTAEENAAEDQQSKYAQTLRMAENIGRNGDPAAARMFYERAAAMQPNELDPQIGLAQAAAVAGDYAQSAQAFRKAIALAPGRADLVYGYARSSLMVGDTTHAIEQFDRYIASNPDDPRGYIGLGIAQDISGAHSAAQTAYLDGLQAAPDNMALRNNLALSLALSNQSDDAVGILRELAQEPAAATRVRQTLALVYAISGRMDAAADLVRQTMSSAEARSSLAFLRSLQGLRGSALAEAALFGRVNRALSMAPDKTDTMFGAK